MFLILNKRHYFSACKEEISLGGLHSSLDGLEQGTLQDTFIGLEGYVVVVCVCGHS